MPQARTRTTAPLMHVSHSTAKTLHNSDSTFRMFVHAAGAYPYDCPADALLDVSWHRTPNDTRGGVTQWLMRPDLAGVVTVSVPHCD
jgi:hypothetical protein